MSQSCEFQFLSTDPGTVKFEAKTKAQNGMKFTTTGQNNTDNGKMLGGAELNVEWPDYGEYEFFLCLPTFRILKLTKLYSLRCKICGVGLQLFIFRIWPSHFNLQVHVYNFLCFNK